MTVPAAVTVPGAGVLDPSLFFGIAIPLARTLGLRAESIEGDVVRARMPFRAEFANGSGNVSGGTMAAALDLLLAAAARASDPGGLRGITVDLTTHFLASTAGDMLGEARCLRRGALAFAQGELRDARGKLLATATGTFKLMHRVPATLP